MRRRREWERAWQEAPGGAERLGSRRLILWLVAAVGLNLITVQLLPGISLQFGSVAVLIVLRTYGPAWGLLAGLGAGLTSAWVLGQPALVVVTLVEVGIVGFLLHYVDDNVALMDAGYWFLVGIPLTWALSLLHPPETLLLPMTLALRAGVNGTVNAVIANILLDHVLGGAARRRLRLRRHLFNLWVVLVLGTGFIVNIVGTRQELSYLYERHIGEMDLSERRLEERLGRWAHGPARLLAVLGSELPSLEPEVLQPRLETFLHLSDAIVGLFVADDQRRVLAGAAEVDVAGALDDPGSLFRASLRGQGAADLQVRMLHPQGDPPLLLYSRAFEPQEGPAGVALVAVQTEDLRGLLSQEVKGTGLRAVVVDPDQRVVASTDGKMVAGTSFTDASSPRKLHAGEPALGRLRWPMSQVRQSRVIELGAPTHWTLHLDLSLAPVQRYLNRRLSMALGVMLGLTVLVLPVIALSAASLTRPLQRLAERSSGVPRRLQKGEPLDWPVSRIRELDTLAMNFSHMTEALRQRMKAMERADQAKDDFLATLGHELRNPLAPISSAVALLSRSEGDPRQMRHTVEVLARQSGHLARLVDDLLDLSRIARAKIHLQMQVVDLRGPLAAAVEGMEEEVRRADHTLQVSLPERPVWVRGDETRLEQIASNLLTNAVKYTPPGGRIEVRLSAEQSARLEIEDNGIGMAQEMLERVFEPFQQLARSGEYGRGGLGIGLTLVRQLVELHGGRVCAQSEGLGSGTRMEVELPLTEGPKDETDPKVEEGAVPANSRHILLVDDNVDAVTLMSELIGSWGHEVHTASDGPEVLAYLRQNQVDVVLLDIGLPTMSGHEVARAIRADGQISQPLLIAVTGYGQDKDRERSEQAGFDAHLVKPVDLDLLEQILSDSGAPAG